MRSSRNLKLQTVLVLMCSFFGGYGYDVARAVEAPSDPDPRIQAYRTEHVEEIRALRAITEDPRQGIETRKSALKKLAVISEDDALISAAKLIKDPSTELAQAAVGMLSSSTVMMANQSNHAAEHETATRSGAYHRSQYEFVLTALREASNDLRQSVNLQALKSLVRLSDEDALQRVRDAAAAGKLAQADAVKFCSQTPGNLGRACLLDYLSAGSLEGKIAAIDALSSMPDSQPIIRDKIFLSSKEDSKLRAAAAEALGRYDPSFSTYALTVTSDPKTSPEVFASTLKGYAASAAAAGKLNAAQKSIISQAIKNKLETTTQADVTSLTELSKQFNVTP